MSWGADRARYELEVDDNPGKPKQRLTGKQRIARGPHLGGDFDHEEVVLPQEEEEEGPALRELQAGGGGVSSGSMRAGASSCSRPQNPMCGRSWSRRRRQMGRKLQPDLEAWWTVSLSGSMKNGSAACRKGFIMKVGPGSAVWS